MAQVNFTDKEKQFFKEIKDLTDNPLVDTDGLEMLKSINEIIKRHGVTVLGAGTNRFAVSVSGNFVVKIPFRDTGRKDNAIEMAISNQVLRNNTDKKNRATMSLGMINNSPSLLIQEKGIPLHYYMLYKEEGNLNNAKTVDFAKYIQLGFEWLMENIDQYNAMILALYQGKGIIPDDLTPEKVAQYCIKSCSDNQSRLAILDYGNCYIKPVEKILCPTCGKEILPKVIEKVADLRADKNMFSQSFTCGCQGYRDAESVMRVAIAQRDKGGNGGLGGFGGFNF